MSVTIMVDDILTAGLYNGFGDESDCVKAYVVVSVDEQTDKIAYTEHLKLSGDRNICYASFLEVVEGIASQRIGHYREIHYDDDLEPHIALK